MRANDYSKGIDGRGYPLSYRDLSIGDRVYFGAYFGETYRPHLTGTVTRIFKRAIQVNGKPVKELHRCTLSFLNEGITGKVWFQNVKTEEY